MPSDMAPIREKDEKLRESEDQYRSLFENGIDGILLTASDGSVFAANPAACRMFGRTEEEICAVGRQGVVDSADPRLPTAMAERARTGRFRGEMTFRYKHGTRFASDVATSVVKNRGDLEGVAMTIRDITARKKADEALRLERDRAQRYLDVAGVILLVLDIDGRVVFINRKGCETLGYSFEEIIGKKWVDNFLPKRIVDDLRGKFAAFISGDIGPGEYLENPVLTRTGDERIIAWHNTVLRDGSGKIVETLSSGEDITERRKAEEELREDERRLRHISSLVSDVAYSCSNTAGRGYSIDWMIGSVEKITGYSMEEIRAHGYWNFLVVEKDLPILEKSVTGLAPGSTGSCELRFRKKGGDVIWVASFAECRVDPENPELVHLYGGLVDVTERKQMEERINSLAKFPAENPNPILRLDKNCRVLDANEASAPLLREWKSQTGGLPPEFKRLLGEALSTRQDRNIDVECIGRVYSFYFKPVPESDYANLYGRDVTERKRLEKELAKHVNHLEQLVEERTREVRFARERLDYLIKSNPAVIFSGKPRSDLSDWQLTYLSERVVSMLGFEPKQFIRHPEFWSSRVHPEDLHAAMEAIQTLWKNGESNCTYRFQHADGRYRWIREEAKAERDDDRRPTEVYGCWIDVTERMQAEEKDKRLNDESAMRLTQLTDQVEALAKSEERLRAAPDVSSGLDIILEAVLWGFGLDFGAVLVIDRDAKRANVRASKAKELGFRLGESYPLGSFVELEDLQTKSVTKFVAESKRSIFGAATVQLVPLLSGKELYGVLALGSLESNPLDPSTIRVLESYAGLIYSFMFERSMTVNPVREVARDVDRAANLEPGQIYLVKKDPAKAFDIFAGTVFSGYEGLCITRVHPTTMRNKYGLEKTPIIWLTGEASTGEQSVKSIQDLSILIGRFLDKAKKAVILLDGFEYIVTNNGFESFIRFLQILKDRVQRTNGVLIAPLLGAALEPKELALVERETVIWEG